ncbi:hypothetical protein H8356DRAFT_1356764 [Neocallimastix lanati (nom. inval.)]|nr:hypothetical protein H8356DRAFT_1356764 [Neocallimastix sp. JGI-2020a]
MKYFKDIEIIYEKFYIISKYCPISSSNVNTVVTDINKVQILTIVAKENRNININDRENNSIITNIVVNSSIGENRVNLSNFLNNERLYIFLLGGRDTDIINLIYKKERDILFKIQIISALFTEIMPIELTYDKDCYSDGIREDHNFFQIYQFKPCHQKFQVLIFLRFFEFSYDQPTKIKLNVFNRLSIFNLIVDRDVNNVVIDL